MREFHVGPRLILWFALLMSGVWVETGTGVARGAERGHVSARNFPEAEEARKAFRVAPGFVVDVFAAEPLLANPVSFDFDEQGRLFVVETHRRRTSVYDIRRHPDWLDADFSFRTVEDRLSFFRQKLQPENESLPDRIRVDRNGDGKFDVADLEVESERVRLIEDRDGDGRADRSAVFADGFSTAVSGVAAGVLARGTNVWFTCIPDLWLLGDRDEDGVAESRRQLLTGFGVHISFGGHDLHGLTLGPDGKLYFSIADRGLNVPTPLGRVAYPDSGAIMRCNPDGTEFELFAIGLRNPQELAFDQFGNLWTGDNNGDGGDKARWVYVLEGSDSGWHMGWQHLPKMGAWNAEKLWELHGANTAAYILPPVAHVGHGPAGLSFYPGTGLPDRYANHFFLCDFPGGVRTFSVRAKGAGYEVVDLHDFLWGLCPVDAGFGPDSGLYVADWIEGWEKTGKGRIYRVRAVDGAGREALAETRRLLSRGMNGRSNRELGRLLGHADQRVRQAAQFELASRGTRTVDLLKSIAGRSENRLARLHAIWAVGQLGRTVPGVLAELQLLLADRDEEVRAQVARVLGDHRFIPAFDGLVAALRDSSLRVRLFASMALGKLGQPEAAGPIVEMVRENADGDPYLRHGAVMALTWIGDMTALIAASKDDSAAVRMAALLAMRRLGRSEVVTLLYDPEPRLVLEAARAIYDTPITEGMSQLASLSSKTTLPEAALLRSLHANYRLGKLENALALTTFAASSDAPAGLRSQALELLARWGEPPPRDLFLGLWRPLEPRDDRSAVLALRSELDVILAESPDPVRAAAIRTAAQLNLVQAAPAVFAFFKDSGGSVEVRVASLRALAKFKDERLAEALTLALNDPNETVRTEAGRLQAALKPSDAVKYLGTVLETGSTAEKQMAFRLMASLDFPVVEEMLGRWIDRLAAGQVPPELELDLVQAVEARDSDELKRKLAATQATSVFDDSLGEFRVALAGGDAEAGRKIFFEHAAAACLRCHKIAGEGGEVGPELGGIGGRESRRFILESIVHPNRQVKPEYATVLLRLENGTVYAGTIQKETAREIELLSPEDGLVAVAKTDVASREAGLSAMPEEMGSLLTLRELRDLVEFLAEQK